MSNASNATVVYAIQRRAKMDWTVNGSLYHRFLKWKIKCETYQIVNWQCYQKQENVRELWPGEGILESTNMYPGACPKKIYAWR